jgi:putative tryptophan/tyrosine transport system substrate-binding protein
LMVDPANPEFTSQVPAVRDAARALNRDLVVLNASTAPEIDAAFQAARQRGARAMVVAAGPFFVSSRHQIIRLAARDAIPCAYSNRSSPAEGGLMSYGNSLPDAYRRNALYVGRILKGAKAGDLPIDRATKFELVINLKTARSLGISVPSSLMASADEVIE